MPKKIEKVPNELPKQINSLEAMFKDCVNFNQDFSDWNVSNVTNMREMFVRASAFNQDLSKWNVDKVTNYDNFATNSGFADEPNKWPAKFRPKENYLLQLPYHMIILSKKYKVKVLINFTNV